MALMPTSTALLYAAVALSASSPAPAAVAYLENSGRIVLRAETVGEFGSTRLYLHGPAWEQKWSGQAPDLSVKTGKTGDGAGWREVSGTLQIPANPPGVGIRFRQRYIPRKDGFEVAVEFGASKAARLNACSFSFFTDIQSVAGRPCRVTTASGRKAEVVVPPRKEELQLWTESVRRVSVPLPDPMTIRLDPPGPLLVQDNRFFDLDTVEFRFNPVSDGRVPAGWRVKRRFIFTFRKPIRVVLDDSAPADDDVSGWVPWICPWDAAPVNVSFLIERPAGRHGFLGVRGDRFVFADGTRARFWGTTLSAAANFPDKTQAAKIAERLARFGVNIVRTHHADAKWASRSLIDYKRDDSRHFDPENLDRFDFFMAELKKRGIYVYLDQLVSRQFTDGDEVPAAEALGPGAKPYAVFDPKLIELQKEFSRRLWTHINPYTGLAPRDDPQFVLAEFTNENDLFTQPVALEPYRTRLEKRYRDWAVRNKVRVGPGKVDFTQKTDDMVRFFVDVQQQYYRDMIEFYRKRLRVRVPLTGSNWSRNSSLLLALTVCDFTDSHAYEDHPHGAHRDRFYNSMTTRKRRNLLSVLAFNRLADRPFFASEWDQPWPNEWRAELPLLMAAAARLQDWDGLTVYTYRHDFKALDYVDGPFETGLDPARFGLFPHAALLFFRDAHAADKTVMIKLDRTRALTTRAAVPWTAGAPALSGTPELNRLQLSFADRSDAGRVVDLGTSSTASGAAVLVSDNGELRRDWKRGFGVINTERTQVAYGLIGGRKEIKLRDMTLAIRTRFATVALSSLTFLPIENSNRLLLTAVGRVRNTGMVYNVTHTRLLDSGKGPMLLEPIVGEVRLRTPLATLRVHALGPRGERLREVPAQWEDGVLTFRIGEPPCTMIYQIASGG
ncbi:MAG: hypothetical protein GXP31_12945 [Kiritimatiellaeota bacterium]|nr:hypothetical protein [Kiritimatiellota bacterium]